MPKIQRRRGAMQNPVTPGWRIESTSRERVTAMARAAGISTSALIDQMIIQVELNDHGVPVWLDLGPDEGELPIDTA